MRELKIYNSRWWIPETRPEVLKEVLEGFLREAGYTAISYSDHYFEPQGYTGIWLLAESHLALHTYPEHGKTYLELSGCSEESNATFQQLLEGWCSIPEQQPTIVSLPKQPV